MLNGRYGKGRFHDADAKAAFGLSEKSKWPDEGMPDKYIQGVLAWVESIQQGRFRLRARCLCPACGANVSLGRLNQHAKGRSDHARTD